MLNGYARRMPPAFLLQLRAYAIRYAIGSDVSALHTTYAVIDVYDADDITHITGWFIGYHCHYAIERHIRR